MNIFRRTLIATAPAALGVLLFAGGASATTITGSTSSQGSNGAFGAGTTGSVSAGQFNQAAIDAAIAAACPVTDTCSGSTLVEIDFSLTVNTTATVTLSNTNAGTSYVGPLSGLNGTYGSPTSGFAVGQLTTVDLNDPVTGTIVEDVPTFNAATTNEFRSSTCTGTAVATAFTNCLAVAHGGQTYSGTGTATDTGSYTGDLSGVVGTYVGAGSVNFGLSSIGGTVNGRLPSNVGISTNTATIQALTNSLTVSYIYTYDDTVNPTGAPEPTTMALVGGALLAIGLVRKKRLS
jgi:hypothetical protein